MRAIPAFLRWLEGSSRSVRFLIVVALYGLYAAVYVYLSRVYGPVSAVLISVPAVAASGLFGMRAAVGVSLLNFPINAALFELTNHPLARDFPYMHPHAWLPLSVLALVCVIVGASHDLYLRLRGMENKVRESRAFYEALFRAAPNALLLVDEQGTIVALNDQAEDLFGYTREELLGQSIDMLIPPEFRQVHRHQQAEYMKSPRVRSMAAGLETYALHKNGTRIPVDIGLAPVEVGKDGQRYIIVGVRDFTMYKEAQARVEWAERRYRFLFEHAPVMYVTTYDHEGAPYISDCNKAFCETLGYSREEVIGRPLTDFYTEESRRALEHDGYLRTQQGEFFYDERCLVTRDGRPIHTLLHLAPIRDREDNVTGSLAMFVDITQLKKTEQTLRRRQEELYLRSRILSRILHTTDLDTIVTGILEEATSFTGAEMGGIYLREDDDFVLHAWRSVPEPILTKFTRVPVNADYDWIHHPTLIHERLDEKGPLSRSPEVKQAGIQARMSIPLHLPAEHSSSPERPVGIIMLASRDYNAFDEDDFRALMGMGHLMALAILHVQTYRQAQERLTRLQVLRDIDVAIIENMDLDHILHIVLERIPSRLGANAVAVTLFDEELPHVSTFLMRLPNGTILAEDAFTVSEVFFQAFQDSPEPVVVYDLRQEPRAAAFKDLIERHGLVSYLGVPLTVKSQTLGVLHILSTQPRRFSAEDVAFFATLAGQAAIGISNARSLDELTKRARAVDAILRVQEQITTDEGNVEDVLLNIFWRVAEATHLKYFRYNAQRNRVELVYSLGAPLTEESVSQLVFTLGEERGLVGHVAATRQPLYVPDTYQEPRWIPLEEVRSVYYVPLVHGQRLYGVVALGHTKPRAFPASRRNMLDMFGHYATTVLENRRLLREAREYAHLLERLNTYIHQLEQCTTVHDLIVTLGQSTFSLVHPDKLAIFVRDADKITCPFYQGLDKKYVEEILSRAWELPTLQYIHQGQTFLVPNIDDLPEGHYLRDLARRGRYGAAAFWPLRYDNEVAAAIVCYWNTPHSVPSHEINVMDAFTRHAAVALHNVRLRERLLRTNDELRQAVQAREEMLQNVSHELRTPLTLIRGYAELISEGIITSPEEMRETSRLILQKAIHLHHLVGQMLLFQQMRQHTLEKYPINVEKWLQETALEWQEPMQEANIRLVVDVAPDTGTVAGHPQYLQQVLDNLLENARKFSPNGGTVTLRAWRERDNVYIAVQDEGIGIPPEKLPYIFDRFYQVDGSSTRRFEGMGLGLSLCKEIVEHHGGHIWAESEGPGKGTTVIFTLPASTEDTKETSS